MNKSKNGFTFIEFLIALAIVATLLGLLVPALLAARANANRKPEDSRQESEKSFYLHTERHDGHLWILNRNMDYFMHHPDCPCHGKVERDDQGK